MRVLVTGHDGYIGSVLAPMLADAGHDVAGLDTFLYEGCSLNGDHVVRPVTSVRTDVRDVEPGILEGFDAVIHLAALSNDPLGDLNASATYAINHRASVRVAEMAREAGVGRFLFASSCSLYGTSGGAELLDEASPLDPVTPYARSKQLVESRLWELARPGFSPTALRAATVYGISPRPRTDLVLNDLVGLAHVEGTVRLRSDGAAWRPLVHVEDVARAYLGVLEAPREAVHARAFNVGRTDENYRIRELAELVSDATGAPIELGEDAGPDARSYRVDCSRIQDAVAACRPRRTVADGIEELRAAYRRHDLTGADLTHRFVRLSRVLRLRDQGRLDDELRWSTPGAARGVRREERVERRAAG